MDTRSARVVVTLTDLSLSGRADAARDFDQLVANDGDAIELNRLLTDYNNAYAANVSFTVGADLPAAAPPAPPVSTVKPLDHVFLIYMENKSANDIVGSPNAPYVNSLLNTHGHATDYHALTHPSDRTTPRFWADQILVSTTTAPRTASPRPTWPTPSRPRAKRGPAMCRHPRPGTGVSGPVTPPTYYPRHLQSIVNDPARAQAHLLLLPLLLTDLANDATAPNFGWIAADGAHDMEGPTSGSSFEQFRRGQLTDQQYNVKAGDEFLAQTLPSIVNSAMWQDPTQRSVVFLTWDEDNNNLSLGIDNQSNWVPMIVIPSPGAVASGMRGGPFVANDYYNHYSLQRTIEDTLGLPTHQ